jgi:hypothetical protein
MEQQVSVFALFGGVRPMARAIGEPPSNVAAWKRVGRIPAEKQPHVLAVGQALGMPLTADHVVFPLGRPDAADPADLTVARIHVACPKAETQRKDIH